MAIDESRFGAVSHGGITVERDPRTKSRILEAASHNLALKRRGQELDDHLSTDMICQRRAVKERLLLLGQVEADTSPAELRTAHSHFHNLDYNPDILTDILTGQHVIWFGLGHGFQDTILGDEAEVPIWVEDEMLWVSPDGVSVVELGDVHEVKTTRRGALPKKAKYPKKHPDPNLAGQFVEPQEWTVEGKLLFTNEKWFRYMLGVMHVKNTNEYTLSVAWILPADMETFKITATRETIEDNWEELTKIRLFRREHLLNGTLPPVTSRAFKAECENCQFLNEQPCAGEVPAQNALESE